MPSKKVVFIPLGAKVKDTVSGFQGVCISRTEYLNGCFRLGIQAKVGKDGKAPDTHWFDEPQLKILSDKAQGVQVGSKKTGGPRVNPKRHKTEKR